jgi:hypothetical protein
MLKWSILKPTNGWETDDSSFNIIQQLLFDKLDVLPNLVKVKFLLNTSSLTSELSSPNISLKSLSPKSIKIISNEYDSPNPALKSSSVTNTSQEKDDIWIIIQKYTPNYSIVSCSDKESNCYLKKFSIPFEYDGLFTPVINGKSSLKTYKLVKDMESDIRKDNKIILVKSCVGFTILEVDNNNSKKKTLYKVHKLEEGSILKFEKFCFIETNKCLNSSNNNENNPSIINDYINNDSLKSTSTKSTTTLGRKSIFTAFLSNILNTNSNSGSLNGASSVNNNKFKSSTSNMSNVTANNQTCFCTGIKNFYGTNQVSLSPSYYDRRLSNENEAFDETQSRRFKKSKIVRVMKCYDPESNAVIYIKDTCQSEFLIDSSYDNYSMKNEYEISCKYLYDMKTLMNSKFATLSNDSVEFELVYRKSTKFNRLPFTRVRLVGDNLSVITRKPSIIIYDVNKNKFFEYFLNDLTNTNQYHFFKASKDSDLLLKYKAKLDWCLTTLNEFKYDVKLVFNMTNNQAKVGVYFEQFNFRTYSRRNFRRRTIVSSSMPTQNKIRQNPTIFSNEQDIQESTINRNHKEIPKTDDSESNKSGLKKLIKFATTTRKSIPVNFDELNELNIKKNDITRTKLSTLFQSDLATSIVDSKSTLSNELADDKEFVTVINIKRKDDPLDVPTIQERAQIKRSPTNLGDFKAQVDDKFEYNIKYINKKPSSRPTIFNSFKFTNLSEFKSQTNSKPLDEQNDNSKSFIKNLIQSNKNPTKISSKDSLQELKNFEITAI